MVTINNFEQLKVWQKAIDIASRVYDLTKGIKEYYLRDQINRAALSISNNIAEGFEYSNAADFNRFLAIAKGSCGEVRSMLFFLESNQLVSDAISAQLKQDCAELGKQIGSLKTYLIKYRQTSKNNIVKESAAPYGANKEENQFSNIAFAANEIFNS
jgi:four helix bundle protein